MTAQLTAGRERCRQCGQFSITGGKSTCDDNPVTEPVNSIYIRTAATTASKHDSATNAVANATRSAKQSPRPGILETDAV